MTQNACPANAKVSEGSSPYLHPSAPVLCLGRTRWTVTGGSLDLLKDPRKVLMEFGGNRMGSREGTHSAIPKLWHYISHETPRKGPLFLAGL